MLWFIVDTIIKLWKISNRRSARSTASSSSSCTAADRFVPVHQNSYKGSHLFHINSISPNIDGLTFLSADDLKITLWQLENPKAFISMVDLRPQPMDDIQQVITTAIFHPQYTYQFLYATSRGIIRICDTRVSSLCESSGGYFTQRLL